MSKANSKDGPKTKHGKARSSQNARVHGLLAKEIKLSEDEQKEFKDFETDLREDLRPAGALQEFLFEEILACAWKIKLALRLEIQQLRRGITFAAMDVPDEETPEPADSAAVRANVTGDPIYSDTRHQLERKMASLAELRKLVKQSGHVPDDLKERTISSFAQWFYSAIEQFRVSNPTALQMSEMLERKRQLFGWAATPPEHEPSGTHGPPEEIPEGSEGQKPQDTPENPEKTRHEKILEDSLKQQFLDKLFELEKSHIQHLLSRPAKSVDAAAKETEPLERFLRYDTTIKRDLYRAITKYRELKGGVPRTD